MEKNLNDVEESSQRDDSVAFDVENENFDQSQIQQNLNDEERNDAVSLNDEAITITASPLLNDNVVVCKRKMTKTEIALSLYAFFWTIAISIACPIATFLSGESSTFFYDFYLIIISPSKLITDYFNIGGLGSTLFNVALCGLLCNLILFISRAKFTSTVLAGYFLVIAHGFYGLNVINMWPPFIGVLLFCIVTKRSFGDNVHIAMFSTSLGPFISEFLFRYFVRDTFVFGTMQITAVGIIVAVVFGIATGFIIPALLPGFHSFHRGYNLFKAGLPIGLLGAFVFAFMYKNFNIHEPISCWRENPLYYENEQSYESFMFTFFATIFLLTSLVGFFLNGRSLKGYNELLKSSGHETDFTHQFGIPLTFINIGIYGLFILGYLSLVFYLTQGVGFTGPTAGVTIAAITFSAGGQHPRNVWPIVVGYVILFLVTYSISYLVEIDMSWTLSSQGYINGLAFATGLCPFVGKYGRRVGIIAGFVCAIICTSTSMMHGGFVLYNGGFSAGLTALILVPILDFYKIKTKHNEEIEE